MIDRPLSLLQPLRNGCKGPRRASYDEEPGFRLCRKNGLELVGAIRKPMLHVVGVGVEDLVGIQLQREGDGGAPAQPDECFPGRMI